MTHVTEQFDDYLHDLLDAPKRAAVETHIAACAECRAALETARTRFAVLTATRPPAPNTEPIVARTLQRIDADERARLERSSRLRRRFVRWGVGGAVAAALFLGSFHIYFDNLQASPANLELTASPKLIADSDGAVRVRLTDGVTRQAMPGVPVEVDLVDPATQRTIPVARFNTDATGSGPAGFRVPDWAEGEYRLRVVARPSTGPEIIDRPIRLVRSAQVMLTTDKPVYQPGQTIHMRALALRRPDLKPIANQPATLTVTDPKGNLIFKKSASSSTFGIASADCELADEIIEGAYTIRVQVGDTDSSLTVDVKPYVLPKFKIDVALDRPFYKPGQMVKGTVRATYFYGKPVVGADVALRAVAHEGSKLVTNAAGEAAFEIPVPDREGAELLVKVTDGADQSNFRAVPLPVSAQDLRIEAIAEGGTLVPGLKNRVFIVVTTPDGRPAPARVDVKSVAQDLMTNDLGVAVLEIDPRHVPTGMPKTAKFDIAAQAAGGLRADVKVELNVNRANRDFLLRTDKPVYSGGETIKLTALGGGTEPVFVDVLHNGQIVRSESMPMLGGKGGLSFDMPPEWAGTMEVAAHRLDERGDMLRKSRVLFVRPAQALTFHATLDAATHKPGERARLALTLTDAQGRPAPGAVSFAAVDEAVFSVMRDRPGQEAGFFLSDPQLLRSVSARPELFTVATHDSEKLLQEATLSRSAQTQSYEQDRESGTLLAKRRAIYQHKRANIDWIETGWSLLIWTSSIVVIIALYVKISQKDGTGAVILNAITMLGLLGVIAFVLWPASMKVREASGRRTDATPDVFDLSGSMEGFDPNLGGGSGNADSDVRIRRDFPETLLWKPQLITDDQGRVVVDIDLADSITTWRLSASAVNAQGHLGGWQGELPVFQHFFVDFNLPPTLTRGDEVTVPVVVSNYLKQPQRVRVALQEAPWFTLVGDAVREIDLGANEVKSVPYRIRAAKVGRQPLQVQASAGTVADAVRRDVEVVPDGRRIEQVVNGMLDQPASIPLMVPDNSIEGSPRAFLNLYPSRFSELLAGLDGIFQMPSGCFEQTSSTTYPNVLALDYLKRSGQVQREIEEKARRFVHLGYQRLLSFEIAGGGFDWYGRPPANRTLTAYGLLQFRDMARVHEVDPALIERTRRWLLDQRRADGSWDPDHWQPGHRPAATGNGPDLARLQATAYIAWAAFRADARNDVAPTVAYSKRVPAERLADPYLIALVALGLSAADENVDAVRPYLERLDQLKQESPDGQRVWLGLPEGTRTTFHGAGRSGDVEATALAVLAQLDHRHAPGNTKRALAWLVSQRDARGTWHSTQATVLALKALLGGTQTAPPVERRIEVTLGGGFRQEIVIPADQADVMRQIDLSPHLKPGTQTVTVTEATKGATGYQLGFRYHVPEMKNDVPADSFRLQVAYDRNTVSVGDAIAATATVRNLASKDAPMVLVELPVPAGFVAETNDLENLQQAQKIGKLQTRPDALVIYLRGLRSGEELQLPYRLRATTPAKVTAPPARVYEYYAPQRNAVSTMQLLTVAGE